jgi:NADH:ubiquinone oxidoreductase subunit K
MHRLFPKYYTAAYGFILFDSPIIRYLKRRNIMVILWCNELMVLEYVFSVIRYTPMLKFMYLNAVFCPDICEDCYSSKIQIELSGTVT